MTWQGVAGRGRARLLALALLVASAPSVRQLGDTLHGSGDGGQVGFAQQQARVDGRDADAEALLVAVARQRRDA